MEKFYKQKSGRLIQNFRKVTMESFQHLYKNYSKKNKKRDYFLGIHEKRKLWKMK